MTRQFSKTLFILVVVALFLVACGGAGANDNANTAENTANDAASNASADADDSNNEAPDTASEDSASSSIMEVDAALAADAVLDPALAAESDEAVLAASAYLYDTLLLDGGNSEGLAIEWAVSDDGLTYEFRLRANAQFSDGTPINTDIVVENFTRWFDPEHPLHGDSAGYLGWIAYFDDFLVKDLADDEAPPSKFDGIEKVDNLVFLLHLNEPMDDFLSILSMPQFSILNPGALVDASYGMSGGTVSGSGAYVVDVWNADSLVLVPSSTYWGAAGSSEMIIFSVE